MGGTASVAKGQAPGKVSGSAAKYEEKGSKVEEARPDIKPAKVEDAQTIVSESAEPKVSPATINKTSDGTISNESKYEEKREPLVPPQQEVSETIPHGFLAAEDDVNNTANGPLLRNNHSASQIALFTEGDVVKVKMEDGTYMEGLLLEVVSAVVVVVDFGPEGVVKECLAADCELIVPSDTMEIGDQVQVQPLGSAMYFVGRLSVINADGTYDVVMEGDDPDDIERNVPESNIRKLMSRRALVVARWKRAALVVSSINNFAAFALDPSSFGGGGNSIRRASTKLPGVNEHSLGSQYSSQQSSHKVASSAVEEEAL